MRKRAVLLFVMLLLAWPTRAQTPPAAASPTTQPAAEGVAPITPQDVLRAVEERLVLAKQFNREGRTLEARAALMDAQRGLSVLLSAEPRNIHAQVLAGELSAEVGNHNEARNRFKAVVEVESGNFRANLGLGRFYVLSRLWRQAESFLKNAERVAPRDKVGEVLRLLTMCYAGQGDRLKAVQSAERAVEVDPTDFESLEWLVSARIGAEQLERAVETARALVAGMLKDRDARPAELWVLQRLSRAYDVLREALKHYHNRMYRRNPRNEPTDELLPGKAGDAARVLIELARVADEQAKIRLELGYHEMLLYVEKAAEYQPKNTRYVLEQAGLREATRQAQRAIESYQHLLEITDPADADRNEVEQNRQVAREALQRLGAPLTSQPAAGTP